MVEDCGRERKAVTYEMGVERARGCADERGRVSKGEGASKGQQ